VGREDLDEEYNYCILPSAMDDNLDGLHHSTGSPKPWIQKHAGVTNVVKSDIRGKLVVIPKLISMQITKVMLFRLKILWMIHIQGALLGVKTLVLLTFLVFTVISMTSAD